MKRLLILPAILFTTVCFAQKADVIDSTLIKTPGRVSFVTKMDIGNASKDGVYLNGYVVSINYDEAKELDGKTVRIKGKVTIIKGIEQHKDGGIRQGRNGDTKYIMKPRIKIISD